MTEGGLQELSVALRRANSEWAKRDGQREKLREQLSRTEEKLVDLREEQELFDKVAALLRESAEYAREQARDQMESVVTKSLQFVFGPEFQFSIQFSEHGGKPVAEFYVITQWEGKSIKTRPQEARGGGVVDIISLALRIGLMETFRPRPEGPLILDEPGKHVSAEYINAMLEFLKSTGEMFGRQIILVTHNPHLIDAADQAWQVQYKSGETEVVPLSLLDIGHG